MDEQPVGDYYWELVLKDDTVIEIPPAFVPTVQRRMGNKEVVNLRTRSIPYSEIKDFHISDKRFGAIPLLDEVAQAFKEPSYFTVHENGIDYEIMEGKWVKQTVTISKWEKYYSAMASYHKLDDNGTHVSMGFMKAMHEIDPSVTPYCSPDEVEKLDKIKHGDSR